MDNLVLNKMNSAMFMDRWDNALYRQISDLDKSLGAEDHSLVDLYSGLICFLNGDPRGIGTIDRLAKSSNQSLAFFVRNVKGMMQEVMEDVDKHREFAEGNDNVPSLIYLVNVLSSYLWADFKIVYSLDNEFAIYFGDSDELNIYVKDLFYIPYSTFYLNFEKVERFKEYNSTIIGAEVSLIPFSENTEGKQDGFMLLVVFVLESGICNPQYYPIYFNECNNDNGIYTYNYHKMYMNSKGLSVVKEGTEDPGKAVSEIDYAIVLIWNFLAYLTSKKPDIKESKVTIKSKKRYEKLKKVYDEETLYEVGYRQGKAIALYKEKVEKEYEEHRTLEGFRKSPRPHLVRAHWHGYWHGDGKKEFGYVWLAPYYKGKGTIDCVITDCVEVDRSSYSKGEDLLYFLLTMKGLSFERQKYIPKTGKYYDACVLINGQEVFVEYDGEQHFRPVKNWDYKKTVISDTEKNKYCKDNSIPLLRIRYDQNLLMSDMIDSLVVSSEQYLKKLNTYMSDEEYYSIRKAI